MKDLVCIVCPRGCRLTVDEAQDYKVTGNGCPRGAEYGRTELQNPTRTRTTTVCGAGGLHRHGQGLPRQAGVGVGKNAAGPGAAQNAAVAPNIHRLDHRQPGQYQADPAGRRAFRQDGLAFLVLAAYSAQAAQQRFDFVFRDAAEKRRIAQTERHGLLLIGLIGQFVGITTSFCLQA